MLISVAIIAPDKNNVRKNLGDVSELIESIKLHGLLQPIGVCPDADGFRIIYGHRRFEAFKKAFGMEAEIECKVINAQRDEDVRAIQITENIQREDVHPLEEAKAICELRGAGKGFQAIASIIGKSVPYVRKRIALNDLIPEMQERFLKNEFDTATALKIALRPSWWQLQNVGKLPQGMSFYATTNLYNAKFDKSDCKTCQFNSNCNSLFETDGDQCYNENCFNEKTKEWQVSQLDEALNKYQYFVNDSWSSADKALVKRIEEAGKIVLATRDLFDIVEAPEKPEENDYNDTEDFQEALTEYEEDYEEYSKEMETALPCFIIGGSRMYTGAFMNLCTKDNETVAEATEESNTEDYGKYLQESLEREKASKERLIENAKQQFQRSLDSVFYENRKEIAMRVKDKLFVAQFLRPAQNYFINEVKGLYHNIDEIGEITFFEAIMLYVIDHMADCQPEVINLPLLEQMAKIADPEKFLELEGQHMNKTESSIKNFDERIKMLEAKIADAKK